jgi:hypothetical protein
MEIARLVDLSAASERLRAETDVAANGEWPQAPLR